MEKLYFVIILVLAALVSLNSCSSEKKPEMKMESQTMMEKTVDVSTDMLAVSKDPSCGMDLTQHAIADTAIYQDKLYGFCSDYCKTKFKEDPEAALAKLDMKEKSSESPQ